MKPINTSIFDFPALMAKGYVCVDRTLFADVRTIDDVKCEQVR